MGGNVDDSPDPRAARRAGPSFSLVAAVSTSDFAQSLMRSGPIERIDLSHTFFTSTIVKHAARYLQSPRPMRVSCVIVGFLVSQCAAACVPFIDGGSHESITTGVVSCIATLLALPGLVFVTGNLSVDMIRRLLNENEFVCSVILNTVQWIAIAISFGLDWRVCICIIEWFVVQLALAADADFRRCGQRLRIRVVACLVTALYFCYSFSGALRRSFEPIFTISDRPSSANDLLQCTGPTLLVLLLRGMYVQKQPRGKRTVDPTTAVIYCSTVRARLALGKVTDLDPPRQLHSDLVDDSVGTLLVRSKTLPAYIDITGTFIKMTSPLPEDGIRGVAFVLLYTLGVLGFLSTCIATFLSQIHAVTHPESISAPLLATGALVGSFIFCALTAQFYHRRLLRELFHTFDVVFASLQFLVGGVFLCELAKWDARCINVLTWTLWFHWVLCLDALTPPIRAYLRLKKLAVTPVALFILYSFVGPFVVLYGYTNTKLFDRMVGAHVRLSTLVLSRVITLGIWCAHLVWDLGVRDDNEFIFLKDRVEYAVPQDVLLTPSHFAPGNAVVPTAATSAAPTPTTALSTPAPSPSSSPSPR